MIVKVKKCRAHNKELVYCESCVEAHKDLNTIKVLRLSKEEKEKMYKKVMKKLDKK